MNAISTALELFRRGRALEAEAICARRLAEAPQDVETLALLGEILTVAAHNERAAIVLARLVQLRPQDAAARRRLGAALLAANRAAEAADTLRAAIHIEPGNPRAYNNLGRALMQLGLLQEAIASYGAALQFDPGYAIAHNNLGLAYAACGEPEAALASFRSALAANHGLIAARVNMAQVYESRGQLGEALTVYEGALAAAPEMVGLWIGRAAVLAKLQRYDSALECLAKALGMQPGNPVALTHQATVLLSLERALDALRAADAALQVEPGSVAAHNVRAGALRRLGRRAEAVHALKQALALDSDSTDAWGNLGTLLHEMGSFEEAVAACRRALDRNPHGLQARTRLLARLIPSLPESAEQVAGARAAFDQQLAELQAWLADAALSEADALLAAQQQFFYLSYEEQSNRSVLQGYRTARAARLASCDFGSVPPAPRTAARAAERFKLGFVSAHVHDHSVFNAILQGWLQSLNRAQFEVELFSLGMRRDTRTEQAMASVEHFDGGSRSTAEWAREIRGRGLDALIFPEIGMNEPTLALASLRLAPRQFASWGHPETSGLPTIDGYFSAELFEPPDAQDHYSEALIRLPNLGVECQPYLVESTPVDLASLGVLRNGPVFICPGAPFKYRPQHDWILVAIARRLPQCTFVFFDHEIAELSRRLEARIAAAFQHGGVDDRRYLRWIPWQPRGAFFEVLRQADVYLDTIGFSGFNTLMQAMQCHLPCITFEGRFMRGRFGSGILRRLGAGLTEWIAHDARQYVDLAVRLGGDDACRARVRAAIRHAESRLYADSSAVTALSEYLLA